MGFLSFGFTKRESIRPDLEKLETIKPKMVELESLVNASSNTEDIDLLRGEMVAIEKKLEEVVLALKETSHGQRYFREINSIEKDSLDSAQDMLPYIHTPLENFHHLENKIKVLRQRLANSSHQDIYGD